MLVGKVHKARSFVIIFPDRELDGVKLLRIW